MDPAMIVDRLLSEEVSLQPSERGSFAGNLFSAHTSCRPEGDSNPCKQSETSSNLTHRVLGLNKHLSRFRLILKVRWLWTSNPRVAGSSPAERAPEIPRFAGKIWTGRF